MPPTVHRLLAAHDLAALIASIDSSVRATLRRRARRQRYVRRLSGGGSPGGWWAAIWNVFGDDSRPDPFHERPRNCWKPPPALQPGKEGYFVSINAIEQGSPLNSLASRSRWRAGRATARAHSVFLFVRRQLYRRFAVSSRSELRSCEARSACARRGAWGSRQTIFVLLGPAPNTYTRARANRDRRDA